MALSLDDQRILVQTWMKDVKAIDERKNCGIPQIGDQQKKASLEMRISGLLRSIREQEAQQAQVA
jgi:hypothetical protein